MTVDDDDKVELELGADAVAMIKIHNHDSCFSKHTRGYGEDPVNN